jgi:alpha-galactosidase
MSSRFLRCMWATIRSARAVQFRHSHKLAWLVTLICGLGVTACEPCHAGLVSADEMLVARRWAAAKFQGVTEVPPLAPGVTVTANYGRVQKNGRGDRPLRIGDARYTRGLYCHAKSQLLVRLAKPATTLHAVLGVDRNEQTQPGRGSVVFIVEANGKELFRSETVREGMPGVPLEVNLSGAREFTLAVSDAEDGISCDQADWADLSVVMDDGQRLALSDLPLLDASAPSPALTPPFSFVYGDKPFAELCADWQVARQTRPLDDARLQHELIYTDAKTGLVVRCVAIEYQDFPTVEWTMYLRNTGQSDTPLLTDIQPLDVTCQHGPGAEFVLHHHRGDLCTPDSYEPFSVTLGPNATEHFAPSGGRPTQGAWPYWNVQWGQTGLLAALGWPGQWAASFTRDGDQQLRIRGGQELTHFTLHPGEEVRTPLVVLQFYDGSAVRAQNVWRRWMLAHNVPRQNYQPPQPIFSSCSGGFFPGLKCNEADELRFIDTYAQQGITFDYWWMDAGWYPCDAWPQVGRWEVDLQRFPRGLKAISDHVHAMQTRLITWFEPERVAPNSWLYDTHPDWLLGQDGGQKLLNLGNLEARAWLTDHVDALLTHEGIDLYRQDFNMDPLGYWRAADAPDRQGITEIRHVEGYLAYWDELQRRHPGMLIDSCASGGRRNDLETLRRAVPLLRSDYQSFAGDSHFAPGNQCHTYGLSSWIPYYGQGVYYSTDELIYSVRSHFCPAFGFCSDVRKPGTDWTLFRRLVDDWRKVSPNLLGDFYPLTPYSLADDVWMAWQFDRPEVGEGAVQAFRRAGSVYLAASIKLQGLDPAAMYAITNVDAPGTTIMSGRDLAEMGVKVAIDRQPGAAVLIYKKVVP